MLKKTVIGLTSDFLDDKQYSAFPYLALRFNYSKAIEKAGATPILLPPLTENTLEYLQLIDGLIVTGGDFDIDPKLYGEQKTHSSVSLNSSRTNFEKKIIEEALKTSMPILGICGGMQLLNVIFGGSLIQHLPDHDPNFFNHEAKPYDKAAHKINITENSLLHKISQKQQIAVNSSHHQAVLKTAPNFQISAISEDGVIEAIEHKEHPFMLGVQWHPEYEISATDTNIFTQFIASCAHK